MKQVLLTIFISFLIGTIFNSCKKKEVPILTTTEIKDVTGTSGISGGEITSEGSSTVIARGVCWSTGTTPTIADKKTTDGAGSGTFTSNISGLTGGTTYYVRAYATNDAGTGYGMAMSFTTLPVDIDGNTYHLVTIGTQVWTIENLKTTKYRNGDVIPNVTDNSAWIGLTTGACCFFNNDASSYKTTYGALYNWYALTDNRNICPTGWHVPSDVEWKSLEMYLGMSQIDADKLNWRGNDQGSQLKASPNNNPPWDGSNSSGYNALPAGYREATTGIFYSLGNIEGSVSSFWTTTGSGVNGYLRYLAKNYTDVLRATYYKTGGYSVRCIKN